MGFPLGGGIAKSAMNDQNTLGAYSLIAMNNANNAYNSFWDQFTNQLGNQTNQLTGLLGPQVTSFAPTPLPGIGNTGPSGDQSKPNLGRAALLGY